MRNIISILILIFTLSQAVIPKRRIISDFISRKWIPPLNTYGKVPLLAGGSEASLDQFPWQVALQMEKYYFCAGALISETWVVTTGHCIVGVSSFVGRVGSLNPFEGGQTATSTTSVLHPYYNPSNLANDIGLVFFQSFLENEYVRAVRLPIRPIDPFVGRTALLSGWGMTHTDSPRISTHLYYIEQVIEDNYLCAMIYGAKISDDSVCLSGSGHKSACKGDSGDPLVIQEDDGGWTLVGVVSFLSKSCEIGYPIVLTRISSHLEWLGKETGIY